MRAKSIEAQTPSRRCGGKGRKRGPAQVSSSSLDHGSKLRGHLPITLEAQWLNGSVSPFHSTGPGLSKVDSALSVWVSRQTDHLTETSAHAPHRLRSRKLK
ncbi:hypothetical protein TNCV_3392371 [Trichonephila clavipes]|nr:hypothetical protein TNCV_3392371 [Trichonephila clavipes]